MSTPQRENASIATLARPTSSSLSGSSGRSNGWWVTTILVSTSRERVEAAPASRLDLLVVDAAVLERERARGVDADHRDLVVDEGRLEVGVDVAPVLAERAEEALPDAGTAARRGCRARRSAAAAGVEEGAAPRSNCAVRARCVRSPETTTTIGRERRRPRRAAARAAPHRRGRSAGRRGGRACAWRSLARGPRAVGPHHRSARGPDAVAQRRRHRRVTSPSVATRRRLCRLSIDELGRRAARRSRAPGAGGRRARAARAAAGRSRPGRCAT